MPHHLAIDIGASSGRAVLGTFADGRLSLRELHRFPNTPITLESGLHWDADKLFADIKHGLKLCAQSPLSSLAIDTWGVNYALLDHNNQPLTPPHHYRDPRTRGLIDAATRIVPRDRIYQRTGIQFMELNTLYQLLADQRAPHNPLANTKQLLFTPDLLNFWLTGIARTEVTIASTSQLFDTQSLTWADDLITALGLPRHIFPAVAKPGTILGPLSPEIAAECGVGPVPVISVGSHDTASAVAAVPASSDGDWAYISSGTWSLVGRELRAPIRTPQALAANFTNECGIEGTIRFHKNITGLWLLQECQRVWRERGHDFAAAELIDLATAAAPFQSLIDPDHPTFAEFGDMPQRIGDYCKTTNQPIPTTQGTLTRCILESLALKTRYVIDTLESLTSPIRTIHIVGGGTQNPLLCQFTADATSRPVLAGPIEATAAGNIMTQALAQRAVTSLSDIRTVIANSFPPTRYEPRDTTSWTLALARFRTLPLH